MLSDRALLIGELLEKSSEIALKYYNSPGTELKPDQSVVTLADKAIEEYLVSRLEDLENDVYVIGEETSESKSLSYIEQALKKKAWIIDPIDGTSMYSARIPIWGISIGYAENGVIVDGGVFAPCTAEMLLSSGGKTYYSQPGTISDIPKWRERLEELSPVTSEFNGKTVIGEGQIQVHSGRFTCPNTINVFCSTIYEGILLATGRHGALICSSKLWDYAGVIQALCNLGFASTSQTGKVNILNREISIENYKLPNAADKKATFSVQEAISISSKLEYAQRIFSMWEPM